METPLDRPPTAGSRKKKRSIWFHVHFWLGWISAVPIALVCLTGALLVLQQDMFRWEHRALFHLEARGDPLSIGQVLERYQSADPPLRVNHLGVPESPGHAFHAYTIELRPEGNRNAQVFLDPYSGDLTWLSSGFSLGETIEDLHRHLVAGRTGRMIVAISSIVLALMCLVGLVLWWPLRGRTFVRAWKRGQALDWHNALGLVALLPLAFMAITGVTFTWGQHLFPRLDALQGHPSQVARPTVTVPAGGLRVSMDVVVERARSLVPDFQLTGIQPSHEDEIPHTFVFDRGGESVQLFMDPFSGEELSRIDGTGTGPVGWYRRHFGKLHSFGPYPFPIRALWGLLSLGGAVIVLTGMWVSVKRWRRPAARANAAGT
jgi:sulfite reductase (NADPH) flavoprotein alpha-component